MTIKCPSYCTDKNINVSEEVLFDHIAAYIWFHVVGEGVISSSPFYNSGHCPHSGHSNAVGCARIFHDHRMLFDPPVSPPQLAEWKYSP